MLGEASIAIAKRMLTDAVEAACSSLDDSEAKEFRLAMSRSQDALRSLESHLAGKTRAEESQPSHQGRVPHLGATTARRFLGDLDEIIAYIERSVLDPAERTLEADALTSVRQLVGQAWGWIICDLQDPLWREYPEMAPPES
jgi:hypothetical protein